MSVELESNLKSRLEQVARARSLSVAELVEEILQDFLNALTDSPAEWVSMTQQRLPNNWPPEDFSDWQPPDADDTAG